VLSGQFPWVVYVILYGPPGVLAARSISPVAISAKTICDGPEKYPPEVPVMAGIGFDPV